MNEVTSDVLNQVRKSNTEYFSSLNSALAQGIMNMNEVQNKISMKRKEIIEEHEKKRSIWQATDGRWKTKLPIGKGKIIAKSNLEDLYDAIVEFYTKDEGMSIGKLYEEWIEYKAACARTTSYIAKIKSDWCTYYKPDKEFVRKNIKKLDTVYLEKWAHTLIKKYKMTKTQYYNTQSLSGKA